MADPEADIGTWMARPGAPAHLIESTLNHLAQPSVFTRCGHIMARKGSGGTLTRVTAVERTCGNCKRRTA